MRDGIRFLDISDSFTIAKNFNTKDYDIYDEKDKYVFSCDTLDDARMAIKEYIEKRRK